jgi:L-iditol 2-dehydrogenase
MTSNIGVILKDVLDLRVEALPGGIPQPANDEVCLTMGPVGICGSDVHFWQDGQIGDYIVKEPLVLGHESAGTVCAVGSDVKHLQVGDRVALEPGYSCSTCTACMGGRYNICPEGKVLSAPPVHGSLSQYFCHKAMWCFKLPDHVSLEEGALLEPLSVAVQACKRGKLSFGQNVLVCGAGPIGLVSMMVAKAGGATVTITDISEKRLTKAKEMGADKTFHVTSEDSRETAESIVELSGYSDLTIECTGVESSIGAGIWATKPGGSYAQVGYGNAEVNFPIVAVGIREIDVYGVFRYANCYPTALALVASGAVKVKSLVSHRFPLKEAVKAFEVAKAGTGIKVIIQCDK